MPGAIPPEQRAAHFSLARRLFNELAQERQELVDGYAFRFPAEILESVARFVANERKCCPFMTFEIAIECNSGPVWLRMTGPDGTRAVLQAELGIAASCGDCNGAGRIGPPDENGTELLPGSRKAKWTTILAGLAAVGVCASCCVLPFAAMGLGVSGAWVATLSAMAPYKRYFVVAAVTLLAFGFYFVYWKSRLRPCAAGSACSTCAPSRSMKVGLWVATLVAVLSVIFDYLESYLG